MAAAVRLVGRTMAFNGVLSRYAVGSTGDTFSVYVPPARDVPRSTKRGRVDVPGILYWLPPAGADDVEFFKSAGAMHLLSRLPLVVVSPSASTHSDGLVYAGQRFDYITQTLPALLADSLDIHAPLRGVAGLASGGYGALLCALRTPQLYKSVSAFAPLCHPTSTVAGRASLSALLKGVPESEWPEWDPSLMAERASMPLHALIDGGLSDPLHVSGELQLEHFRQACKARAESQPATIRLRQGYDGSHFFVATFVQEHLRHHAAALAPPDAIRALRP